eukprot:365611-Chlamydomonas_euryale.AAC.22
MGVARQMHAYVAKGNTNPCRQHDMSEIYSTRQKAGGELLAKTAERTYRETSKVGSDPPPSDKPHFSRQATVLEQSVHPPFLSRSDTGVASVRMMSCVLYATHASM